MTNRQVSAAHRWEKTLPSQSSDALISIGQTASLSRHLGRYALGDTQIYATKSTTSINRQRLIRAIAMKRGNGLEFPVVALPGVGHIPAAGEDEKDAARVFYVAATRATQKLVITVSGSSSFGTTLHAK